MCHFLDLNLKQEVFESEIDWFSLFLSIFLRFHSPFILLYPVLSSGIADSDSSWDSQSLSDSLSCWGVPSWRGVSFLNREKVMSRPTFPSLFLAWAILFRGVDFRGFSTPSIGPCFPSGFPVLRRSSTSLPLLCHIKAQTPKSSQIRRLPLLSGVHYFSQSLTIRQVEENYLETNLRF